MWCWDQRNGRKGLEDKPPCLNWPIIIGVQLTVSATYSLFTPSIYQFITTPRSLPEEQKNIEEDSGKFWPGLGGSESLYARVLMARAFGELFCNIMVGYMVGNLPYIASLILTGLLYVTGGIMYALTTEIWMFMVANIILGGAGGCAIIVHTYIGEVGTKLDEIRRRKSQKPLKVMLYIAYSFSLNGGYFVSFMVTSVLAQFPNINPYRSPAWFLTAISSIFTVITLMMFRNPRAFSTSNLCKINSCKTRLAFSAQLNSRWCIRILVYTFLILSSYIVGQLYSVLYTLITPVLSDKFGFDVANTSYYLIGTAVVFLGSSFILLAIKLIKVNDRLLLGVTFILGLAGVTLIGDWQGIGHDPCSSANIIGPFNTSTNGSGLEDNDYSQSGMFSADSALISEGDSIYSPVSDGISSSSNSSLHNWWVESCVALSSSSHQCFWNPKSRITGEFCNTCHTACYSERKSFNIYQFSLGVLLVCLASALGFVSISAIASAYTPTDHQARILSICLFTGTLARLVSPLWFVETYEVSGKHTYIPMGIVAVCLVVLLVLLVAFYKELAPKCNTRENNLQVTATFNTLEQEEQNKELGLLGESALTVSALSPVASNNSYVASDERTEDIIVPGSPTRQDKTFVISVKSFDHLEFISEC